MKTNVSDTSIEVYYDHVVRDTDIPTRIEKLVKAKGPMTNKMIAKATGLETSTVSGAVNRMKTPLNPILVECFKKPCAITGKRVIWVNHKDNLSGHQFEIGGLQ